jgi:signal transduction histidine kinase
VHPEDLSCCLEIYVQSFDRRKPFEMEYRLRRADGEYRWIIAHGVPRFRPDGSFLGYIGSCKDFTSRREAETVLIKSHEELERRVRQRTAELVRSNQELENQIRERRDLEALVLSISEREQQRIGQDLHDGLCQQLTGIKFRSRLLEQKLAKRGLAEAADAHAIEALLSQAVEQARGQARGLNPVCLEADGLMTALQELAGSIADVFGIQCSCNSEEPVFLHDHAIAIHLYRIAQEAITNAIKHGKAGQVRLRLAERDGHICLEIQDDGTGFPAAPQKNGGIGLHIMNYRARTIGAALEVQSAGRDGTLVTCSLPKPQLERATQE